MRAVCAKCTRPEDFLLVHMKKGELRGPGLQEAYPMEGSWELTERARRSTLVASQPLRRGQFGGGSGPGSWGNLFGQDPKEMGGQGRTYLACRGRPPGKPLPSRAGGSPGGQGLATRIMLFSEWGSLPEGARRRGASCPQRREEASRVRPTAAQELSRPLGKSSQKHLS